MQSPAFEQNYLGMLPYGSTADCSEAGDVNFIVTRRRGGRGDYTTLKLEDVET